MNVEIQIRPIKKEDLYDGALLMSYAFGDKLPALKKYDEYDVRDFMVAGGVFDENNLEGHYVAVADNKIAGIMHLETAKQHNKKHSVPVDEKYLIKKFGLLRSLFCGLSFAFLHSNITEDEFFVDFIAVHPDYRGQGIGSKLLDFGEKIARDKDGISEYSLSVIGKNVGAKKLYERKGFVVTESKRHYLSRLFTGIKMHYKMVKRL